MYLSSHILLKGGHQGRFKSHSTTSCLVGLPCGSLALEWNIQVNFPQHRPEVYYNHTGANTYLMYDSDSATNNFAKNFGEQLTSWLWQQFLRTRVHKKFKIKSLCCIVSCLYRLDIDISTRILYMLSYTGSAPILNDRHRKLFTRLRDNNAR